MVSEDFSPFSAMIPRLIIPVRDQSREEVDQAHHFETGRFMARQDRWAELSEEIARQDSKRAATIGGVSVARLMMQGARADLVSDEAMQILQLRYPGDLPECAGFGILDCVLEEYPFAHPIAGIAALTHIDCGLALCAKDNPCGDAQTERAQAHFRAALTILDRHNAFELDSPVMAAARCKLPYDEPNAAGRIADDFEDLIDLDPGTAHSMRLLGLKLLPSAYGSYVLLDREARRTAIRTEDVWGLGGYTWVYLDALRRDTGAFQTLNVTWFLNGIADILDRCPCQHYANLFSAHLSELALPPTDASAASQARRRAMTQLEDGFAWILQAHLREIHPLIWADAIGAGTDPWDIPDRSGLSRRGRAQAYSRISRKYSEALADGNIVQFTDSGVTISPAF